MFMFSDITKNYLIEDIMRIKLVIDDLLEKRMNKSSKKYDNFQDEIHEYYFKNLIIVYIKMKH